jgi:hypothetical protein
MVGILETVERAFLPEWPSYVCIPVVVGTAGANGMLLFQHQSLGMEVSAASAARGGITLVINLVRFLGQNLIECC